MLSRVDGSEQSEAVATTAEEMDGSAEVVATDGVAADDSEAVATATKETPGSTSSPRPRRSSTAAAAPVCLRSSSSR